MKLLRAAIFVAAFFFLNASLSAQDLEAESGYDCLRVGHTCTGSGEFDQAIVWFKRAAEEKKFRPEAYCGIGDCFQGLAEQADGSKQKKLYQTAVDWYRRAIDANPRFYRAYWRQANALNDLKEFKDSIACCEEGLKLNQDANLYRDRADAYVGLKNNHLALDDYARALRLSPKHYLAHLRRGQLYFRLGKYRDALNDYSQAIEAYPERRLAYEYRLRVAVKLGLKDLAHHDQEMLTRSNRTKRQFLDIFGQF